ncbi:hypothetical protein J6590_096794 [Homalodisca vitripennis]|nr:hypothetical protein J6590_096794 [Homalodisca vitripennis]
MDHLKSEFKSKEEELQTLGAEIKILESRLDLEKDIRQEEMDTSRSKSKTNQLLRFSLSTNARCVSASGVCRAAAATGPSLCVVRQSKPSVVPPTANSSFLEAMSRGTV